MSLAARRRADLALRWAATGPYAAVHPLQQVVVDVRLRVAFLVLSGAPGALLAILQDAQGLLDAGAGLCQQGTGHLRGGARSAPRARQGARRCGRSAAPTRGGRFLGSR